MKEFKDLFKEYISEQDVTVYRMSKDTGINRSFIQSIMTGNKKMSEKSLSKIVNTTYFTESQVHNLCTAFYAQQLGAEKFGRLEFFERGVRGDLRKLIETKPIVSNRVIPEVNTFYCGKENILSLITEMLSHGSREFYSNFSFSSQEINALAADACRNGRFENFFHYTSYKDGDAYNHLRIMFNSIHYAQLGYETYIYDDERQDEFFPYFMLTDEYYLQYDKNGENAYLLPSQQAGAYLRGRLDVIKSRCHSEVYITKDAFDYMYRLQSATAFEQNEVCSFSNVLCAVGFTPDIIEAIATPKVKDVPGIIEQLTKHYDMYTNAENGVKVENSFITYEALENFVKDGRIYEFPPELANHVPKELRAEFLKGMVSHTDKLRITNPHTFSMHSKASFQFTGNLLTVVSCTDGDADDSYLGKIMYRTSNRDTLEDFKNFIRYFSNSEKTYTPKSSEYLLNNFCASLNND